MKRWQWLPSWGVKLPFRAGLGVVIKAAKLPYRIQLWRWACVLADPALW